VKRDLIRGVSASGGHGISIATLTVANVVTISRDLLCDITDGVTRFAAMESVKILVFFSIATASAAATMSTPTFASEERNVVGAIAPHVILVGRDQALTRIAEAANRAKSGDVIEVEAGTYVGDIAIWTQSNLTIRAVGGRARIEQKDGSAEDKALWVIKGDNVLIENFEFAGAHVPGHNGAGIRHEGGKLTVRNCLFEGNEMGLLTWNDEHSTLIIEKSEFRNNLAASTYRSGDPIGHQIYVGRIAMFTLTESYVHHGAFGHLVKSRARENRVFNNRISDEINGRASYELEFPNGGIAYVVGNIIRQSSLTENANIVSFGAEGYHWQQNELYLVNNTLVDGLASGGNFLRVKQGANEVRFINNLLLGRGRLSIETSWKVAGNARAARGDVPFADAGDYRLSSTSRLVRTAVDPGAVNGISLGLAREYAHPRNSHVLAGMAANPGALQTLLP